MNLMIIDGIPRDHIYADYSDIIVKALLAQQNHKINYFRLRDMTIKHCTGCWSCWYKTPGLCPIKDDQEQITSRLPHSDMVLYITPIIAGYESALLKTCKDRSIPTAHPYITIRNGEQHHYERYDHAPDISVLALTEEDTSPEDIDLLKETYKRVALNMDNKNVQIYQSNTKEGGITHVLNRL